MLRLPRIGQPSKQQRLQVANRVLALLEQASLSASVEVTLSNEIRAGGETASFDEAKVQEMRKAIESGTFPLDARRIAENFAALEKLI